MTLDIVLVGLVC